MTSKKGHKSLGARLREKREELHLGVEELAQELTISPRFITAFEGDEYDVFPAKVYAVGFLKKLLVRLRVNDYLPWVEEFETEWGVRNFHKKKETTPLPSNPPVEPYLTPGRLAFGLVILSILAILVFFGLRLKNFLGSPKLLIREPAQTESRVDFPTLVVKGEVEKESGLTINGREITIDEMGRFDEAIELLPALNTLEFLVQDKFGKETRAVKYVFVR